ncbi:scavenger receptor class B member 1 isoform X2 [Aethina tumida]|uniref:scavenger receptor class B member 1 isoform X2 n=1 Tax=Aethina tumida TaxID=116153 RepID=UPI00214947CB|nr:scavenger receptor class B member 1 isoform X2 [Aethina tumida]
MRAKIRLFLQVVKETVYKIHETILNCECAIIVCFLGMLALLSGTFIALAKPYDVLFKWKSTFGDGGEIYEIWRTPPVDLYLRVFLWNVTNRDEFMSGKHTKLKVQEVGPYVYKELMSHENVTFNANGTLSANPKHTLVWVPELSEGRREDDLVIMPNIALLSIAHVVSDDSYFTKLGLNLIIRQTDSQPLVQMTAREFMFGYKSELMSLGNQFMPAWIYFDKLGLIDRMYDFDGDYETVYTGETDLKLSGLLDTYSGSTKIPQWDSPCGDVKYASDATKFNSFIKPNDTLLFFRKSMCRAKKLVRVNETVHTSMKAYVYNFESSDDNGWVNETNKCFCRTNKCLPPGLLDVNGCYYGFPIALSYPHFLDGDKTLSKDVEGLNPDPEKHRSYFVVQPDSGLPLDVAVRYQINMALGDIKTIANSERFDNMILPLLWTESRMYSLPETLATKFRFYLNVLPTAEQGSMYMFFASGALLLLYSVIKFVNSSKKPQNFYNCPYLEEEFGHKQMKLDCYLPEKRASMTKQELEDYFSSLVTPLNQEISFLEFQEMKEEIV